MGLPETENQQGTTFDEICWVHMRICTESKKIRKSNNEEGGDKQKKNKTHNRQCKTRPISVCECVIVIFKMLY